MIMKFELSQLKFNEKGLIPAITQDFESGTVLMLAWMNMESIRQTLETKRVTYWSRSRSALWEKGATSGHTQELIEFRFDCCLLYTSPSPRDRSLSRMPSSA